MPPFSNNLPFSVIKSFVLFHFELFALYCNIEPSFNTDRSMSDNELILDKDVADGTVTETAFAPDEVVLN